MLRRRCRIDNRHLRREGRGESAVGSHHAMSLGNRRVEFRDHQRGEEEREGRNRAEECVERKAFMKGKMSRTCCTCACTRPDPTRAGATMARGCVCVRVRVCGVLCACCWDGRYMAAPAQSCGHPRLFPPTELPSMGWGPRERNNLAPGPTPAAHAAAAATLAPTLRNPQASPDFSLILAPHSLYTVHCSPGLRPAQSTLVVVSCPCLASSGPAPARALVSFAHN